MIGYNVHVMGNIHAQRAYRVTDNASRRGLYFAYGSNLHLQQMFGSRCPKAKPLFKARLDDWRLVFRGCADIEHAPGDFVVGGVFEITPECEAALDRYEGYPTYYTKATAKLTRAGCKVPETMMFYVMGEQSYESAPNVSYFQTIEDGYFDFRMTDDELERLHAAADAAAMYEDKHLRSNPDLVRTARGRYQQRPFIAARELERKNHQPYAQSEIIDFTDFMGLGK